MALLSVEDLVVRVAPAQTGAKRSELGFVDAHARTAT